MASTEESIFDTFTRCCGIEFFNNFTTNEVGILATIDRQTADLVRSFKHKLTTIWSEDFKGHFTIQLPHGTFTTGFPVEIVKCNTLNKNHKFKVVFYAKKHNLPLDLNKKYLEIKLQKRESYDDYLGWSYIDETHYIDVKYTELYVSSYLLFEKERKFLQKQRNEIKRQRNLILEEEKKIRLAAEAAEALRLKNTFTINPNVNTKPTFPWGKKN